MNTFGRLLQINIFGESHGSCIAVGINGCPAGINLCENDFLPDLLRRKPSTAGTTTRHEPDVPNILTGLYNNKTTGSPLLITVPNTKQISTDYEQFINIPRPGHADFVAQKKFFGCNDPRGGGHFSGRLTLALVLAGVIAKKITPHFCYHSALIEAGGSANIEQAVQKAINQKNSIGGIIECSIKGVDIGLGEPFFDSFESVLSHLLFSIPSVKGVEFGAGFLSAKMLGSDINDTIINKNGKTNTNNSGGINGGITNGNNINFKVAIKPTASIGLPQQTFNFSTNQSENLTIQGRHDTCIALRAPVIIEAAAAIVLSDFYLLRQTQLNTTT